MPKAQGFSHAIRSFSIKDSRYLDLWPYRAVYQLPGYKSYCGLFIALIVFAIMLVNIITTARNYANEIPTVVFQSMVPMNYSEIDLPRHGLAFFTQLPNGSTIPFYNTNYWTTMFRQVIIQYQDRLPRIKTTLATVPCGFEANLNPDVPDQGNITNMAVCPNGTAYVQGSFDTNRYKYMEITVSKCSCSVNVTCSCAADADILSYWYNSTVNFYFRQTTFDARRTYGQYWRGTPAYYYGVDIYLVKQVVNVQPKYFFGATSYLFLYPSNTIDRLNQPSPGQLIRFYVRLDDQMLNEYRQPPTFLALLGSWGAIWSFLALTLGNIALRYNRWAFHKRFPREKVKDSNRSWFNKFGKYDPQEAELTEVNATKPAPSVVVSEAGNENVNVNVNVN